MNFTVPSRRRLAALLVVSTVLLGTAGATSADAAGPHVSVDTKAPYAPKDLTVVSADRTSVNLTWLPSVDDVGVAEYRVFRNGTEITTTADTKITLTSQPENRTLYYQVLAVDAAGNRSVKTAPVTATIDTIKPSAPQVVWSQRMNPLGRDQPGAATAFQLSIEQRTADTDVAKYAILRNGAEVATTGAGQLPDGVGGLLLLMGQPVGVTMYFQVQAIDRAGNRSVRTPPLPVCLCDTTPPTTPSNVVVTKQGAGVRITWDPSSDASSKLTPIRYIVEINGSPKGGWTQPPITDTVFDVATLTPGQRITVAVLAVDSSSNVSERSTPVTLTL